MGPPRTLHSILVTPVIDPSSVTCIALLVACNGRHGRFSLAELQAAALGGRGVLAEDLREAVVAACEGVETATLDGVEEAPSAVEGDGGLL